MTAFDTTLFEFIHAIAGHSPLGDAALIFLARALPYFLALGFILLLADVRGFRTRFYYFTFAALALMLSRGIIVELIGYGFHRPRPFEALGFSPLISESASSMPSGHAAFFFALAFVVWCMNRRWGALYVIVSSVVVLARVASGVHYPSDIFVGALIGLVSAYVIEKLIGRYNASSHEEGAPDGMITPPLTPET